MDDDDFATAVEAQIPALRRYAYALTRDHDRADDLVQDCLERALSRRHLRRRDSDLAAWLFTILRNMFLNDRRRRSHRGLEIALDGEAGFGVPPSQDSGVEARDALAALGLLSEKQQSLLLLIGVEDLSYEEAARVLGIPIGTVMSRLSRARQRLRSLLETGRPALLRRVK